MPASVSIFEATHSGEGLGDQFSRIAVGAYRHPFRASRFEPASGADASQIGRVTVNGRKSHVASRYARDVSLRKTHQGLRVRMKRLAKDILRLSLLDDPAGIHNDHAIGES